MNIQKSESNDTTILTDYSKKFVKTINPALIVTLFASAFYFIGYSYSNAYLLRFNISNTIDFPPYYFLLKSIPFALVGISYLYFIIKTEENFAETIKGAFFYNIIFLIFPITIFLFYGKYLNENFNYIFILLMLFFLIMYIWISWNKVSMRSLWSKSNSHKVLILLGIFSILCIFAGFLGDCMATEAVEGNFIDPVIVEFFWNENSHPEFEGKEFIPIFYRNGNYYVVNKQNPAPKYIDVYIIPENKIEFAILKR